MKKPSIEQVKEYMEDRDFITVDQAEAFHDHHESGGWKVGKKPMVKWEAAVRTWIRNAQKWSKPNEKSNGHKQSFADNVSGQAERARQQLADSGICANNIRPIRSIGGSVSE